jgi:hypothetical protein
MTCRYAIPWRVWSTLGLSLLTCSHLLAGSFVMENGAAGGFDSGLTLAAMAANPHLMHAFQALHQQQQQQQQQQQNSAGPLALPLPVHSQHAVLHEQQPLAATMQRVFRPQPQAQMSALLPQQPINFLQSSSLLALLSQPRNTTGSEARIESSSAHDVALASRLHQARRERTSVKLAIGGMASVCPSRFSLSSLPSRTYAF